MPSTIADVLRRLSRTRHENSACRNERGRQLRRPLTRFSCLTVTRWRGYGYAERAAVTLLVMRRHRIGNFTEGSAELCAEAVHDGDDCDCDAGRDKAVFNGGSAGFILEKRNNLGHWSIPLLDWRRQKGISRPLKSGVPDH